MTIPFCNPRQPYIVRIGFLCLSPVSMKVEVDTGLSSSVEKCATVFTIFSACFLGFGDVSILALGMKSRQEIAQLVGLA